MKVELKKSKITSSILNQSILYTHLENFDNCNSLGWCIDKGIKFLVFHKEGLLKLMKYETKIEMTEDMEQIDNHGTRQLFFNVRIKRPNRSDEIIKYSNKQDAEEYKNKYESLIKECKEKGQFYI